MTVVGDNAKGQLTSIVDRIERLNVEIKDLGDDKNDIFKEAAGAGYDVKVLRKVIALRKIDPSVRAEQEAIMETYLHALEMLAE